jgi:hypothetical protein
MRKLGIAAAVLLCASVAWAQMAPKYGLIEAAGGGGFANPATADLDMSTYDIAGTGTGYIQYADATLDATTLVGTADGDIGHAGGVIIVPAVAGKIIVPLYTIVKYTFAVAAYTGGGNVRTSYETSAGLVAISPTINAQFVFVTTAYSSSFFITSTLGSIDVGTVTATGLVNVPVVLQGTAYTQPGTAAGTAAIRTAYILMDAP